MKLCTFYLWLSLIWLTPRGGQLCLRAARVKAVPFRETTVPGSDGSWSQYAKEEPLWSGKLTIMVQNRWPIVVAILLSILTQALVIAAVFLH
jgi:hypothetical protein